VASRLALSQKGIGLRPGKHALQPNAMHAGANRAGEAQCPCHFHFAFLVEAAGTVERIEDVVFGKRRRAMKKISKEAAGSRGP
jgi:hypothetical protein